ncbi:interferon regulatory factor 9 isoform X2 [Lepisosteus oculatus]|uniref:interferon regulatory factor 9 isoform X2 n=1 Tax=Lepisosteus oculatus TaxID=7918 RepID=UPI00371C41CE
MATGRVRSTRRLRSWLVEQVSSGRYPGLVWDDPEKTMFRIPWKHAGKQDFRSDEDAAIFKAWAEFKGKLRAGQKDDPACWKTRLRCALNKSPEFSEVRDRSQLDISEPYKVYRLVPLSEQAPPARGRKTKMGARAGKRKRVKSESESESEEEEEEEEEKKRMRTENVIAMEPTTVVETVSDVTAQLESMVHSPAILKPVESLDPAVNEIEVNFRIETSPHITALPSLLVSVLYGGEEVLRREVQSRDVRIAYSPSHCPSSPPSSLAPFAVSDTERISLPEPSAVEDPSRRSALMALLPYLERGIMLASTNGGIHVQRFCQGRVFWTGPTLHMENHAPRKLERTPNPVTLFDRQAFRQELELFRSEGGSPPQYKVTLCFGEELTDSDNCADKLITVQVYQPWAQQQVLEVSSVRDSITLLQNLASQSPFGEVTLSLIEMED